METKLFAALSIFVLLFAVPVALADNGDGYVVNYKPDTASTGSEVDLWIEFTNDAIDGSCLDEIVITAPGTWTGTASVDGYDRGGYDWDNKADAGDGVNLVDDDQSVRINPDLPLCAGETVNIEIGGLVAPSSYEVSEIEILTSDQDHNAGPSKVRELIDTLPEIYVTSATKVEIEYLHITDFSKSGFYGRAWGAWARLDELAIDASDAGNLKIEMETGSTDEVIFDGSVSKGEQWITMDYGSWDSNQNTANLKDGYLRDQAAKREYHITYSGSSLDLLGSTDEILDDEELVESGLTGARGTIIQANSNEVRKILVQLVDDNDYDVNEQIPLQIDADIGEIQENEPYMTDSDGNSYFTFQSLCEAGVAEVEVSTDPLATEPSVTEHVGIKPDVPYSYEVTVGDGAEVGAGESQLIEVTVYDYCGNVISNTDQVLVEFDYLTDTCGDMDKLAQSPGAESHDHEEEYTEMGVAQVYLVTDCQLCTHDVQITLDWGLGGETIQLFGVPGAPAKMQVTIDEDEITADECVDALIEVVDQCGNRVEEILDPHSGHHQQWESMVFVEIMEPLEVDQPGWASSSQTYITGSDFREEENYGSRLKGKLNNGAGMVEVCGCMGLGTFDLVASSDTIEDGEDTVSVINADPDCIETSTTDQLLYCEREAELDIAVKDVCGNYWTNQDCLSGPATYCVDIEMSGSCQEDDAHLSTNTVCIDVGAGGPGYAEPPVTIFRDTDDCCQLDFSVSNAQDCCEDFPELPQCGDTSLLFHGAPSFMTTQFYQTRTNPHNGEEQLHDQMDMESAEEVVSEEVLDLFTVYDQCGHIVKDFDGSVDVRLEGEDCLSHYQVDHPIVEVEGFCVPVKGDFEQQPMCSGLDEEECIEAENCGWMQNEACEEGPVIKKLVMENCASEGKDWTPLEEEDMVVDKLAFKADYEGDAAGLWLYVYMENENAPGLQPGDRLVGKAPLSPLTIIELMDAPTRPVWDDQREGGVVIRAGDSRDFYVVLMNQPGRSVPCGEYYIDFLWYQDYTGPDITEFGSGWPDSDGDEVVDTYYFNGNIGNAAVDGVKCLFANQMPNGGWESGGTEYNEYTGEACRAIASLGDYNAIIRGADRLLDNQNTDGGWAWMTGTPSDDNVLGVTAYGVLKAYQMTGETKYMESLEKAYQYALNTPELDSCPDVSFLVELSEETGDDKYAELAQEIYDERILETKFGDWNGDSVINGKDIADKIINVRPDGLKAWDTDLCVKAAKSLNRYFGDERYGDDKALMAEALYEAMYGASVEFDPTDDTQDYFVLGISGAIDTFRVTSFGDDKMDGLVNTLLAQQDADGCWAGDSQATAYAVLELQRLAFVEDYYKDSDDYNWINFMGDSRNDDYNALTPDYGFGDKWLFNLPFKEGQAWMKFRDLTAEEVKVHVLKVHEQGDVCGYGWTELDEEVRPNPEVIQFNSQPATQVKLINHDEPPKTVSCDENWDEEVNAYHFNLQTTDGFDNPHGKEVSVALEACLKMPFSNDVKGLIGTWCMMNGHHYGFTDAEQCEAHWMDVDHCYTKEDLKEFILETDFGQYMGEALFGDYFGEEFTEWVDAYFEEAKVEFWDMGQNPLPYHPDEDGVQLVTTDSDGQAQFYVTANKAGGYKIIARPLALDGDTAYVYFQEGAPAKLDLMALPSFGVPADGEQEAMLLLRAFDTCGNIVYEPIHDVTVEVTEGEQVYISQDFEGKNNYDGDVTGTLWCNWWLGFTNLAALSDLPQTATLLASSGEMDTDTTEIQFQGAPTKLAITKIEPSDRLPGDGETGAWVTVQVQDIHGNRVTGYKGQGYQGDPGDPWGRTDYRFENICFDLDEAGAMFPIEPGTEIYPWEMDIDSRTFGWMNWRQTAPSMYCGDLLFGEGKVYVVLDKDECEHGGTIEVKVWDAMVYQGQEFNENGIPVSDHATQLDPDMGEVDFVDPATKWNVWADKQVVLADGETYTLVTIQVENQHMDVRQAVEANVFVGGEVDEGAEIAWIANYDGYDVPDPMDPETEIVVDRHNPTSVRAVTSPITGRAYLLLKSDEAGVAEVTVTGGQAYVCDKRRGVDYQCNSENECIEVYNFYNCHYTKDKDLSPAVTEVEFLEVSDTEMYLHAGWNFVSTPYELEDPDYEDVFADVMGDVLVVYAWDASTQSWVALSAGDDIEPLEAYWVKMNAPGVISLDYNDNPGFPEIPTKEVKPGWNAVGLTWDSPMSVMNALISISDSYSQLIGWIAGQQSYDMPVANTGGFGPMEAGGYNMQPKMGYWIWVTGADDLAGLTALGS